MYLSFSGSLLTFSQYLLNLLIQYHAVRTRQPQVSNRDHYKESRQTVDIVELTQWSHTRFKDNFYQLL